VRRYKKGNKSYLKVLFIEGNGEWGAERNARHKKDVITGQQGKLHKSKYHDFSNSDDMIFSGRSNHESKGTLTEDK
jgi:hypothetical protein